MDYYKDLSYEEAKEIVEKGGYKHIAGWSEFEAFAKYYCNQISEELFGCIKIWRNGRTGGRGAAMLIGSPEEIYCWISWDSSGLISSFSIIRSLKSVLGVEIDRSKIDEAHINMIKKVLGVYL
jgi:hypothetical protein